jgi:hypothetical protein
MVLARQRLSKDAEQVLVAVLVGQGVGDVFKVEAAQVQHQARIEPCGSGRSGGE